MSEQTEACEKPATMWEYYGPKDLMFYILRNMKKCDCSFVLKDPKNDGSEKVLESFQWILREMSTILAIESSHAKNCKLVPISDPNFETILTYGHTKTLDVESFDELVCLYESAFNFGIPALRDAILIKLKVNDEVDIDWINFFRVAYLTSNIYSDFKELYALFNKKVANADIQHIEHLGHTLESKIHLIPNFHFEMFYDFIDDIKTRLKPLIFFKIVDAYVLKNIFDGKDPKPSKLQENVTRNVVNFFLQLIKFDKMNLNDYQNGPKKAIWIDEYNKERILKEIAK